MRTLKYLDTAFQSLMATVVILCFFVSKYTWIAFLVLVLLQLASTLAHRSLQGRLYASRHRGSFNLLLFFLIVTCPLTLWFGYAVVIAWLPCSFWYAYICYVEATIIDHKQSVHLK